MTTLTATRRGLLKPAGAGAGVGSPHHLIAGQGVTGFDEKPWNCFVGPAGIPAEPLEKLRTALRTTLQDPAVVAALNKAGCEDVNTVPVAQIADLMRADLAKLGEVIKRAKITLGN